MKKRIFYVLRQYTFIVSIVLLCLVFLAIGMMIGYGVIGDGKNAFDILSIEKWKALLMKFNIK